MYLYVPITKVKGANGPDEKALWLRNVSGYTSIKVAEIYTRKGHKEMLFCISVNTEGRFTNTIFNENRGGEE